MLASLHSKFYHIDKSKLRERIYVYRTVPIYDKGEVMFNLRVGENTNYFKTDLYTIVSSNTLER